MTRPTGAPCLIFPANAYRDVPVMVNHILDPSTQTERTSVVRHQKSIFLRLKYVVIHTIHCYS